MYTSLNNVYKQFKTVYLFQISFLVRGNKALMIHAIKPHLARQIQDPLVENDGSLWMLSRLPTCTASQVLKSKFFAAKFHSGRHDSTYLRFISFISFPSIPGTVLFHWKTTSSFRVCFRWSHAYSHQQDRPSRELSLESKWNQFWRNLKVSACVRSWISVSLLNYKILIQSKILFITLFKTAVFSIRSSIKAWKDYYGWTQCDQHSVKHGVFCWKNKCWRWKRQWRENVAMVSNKGDYSCETNVVSENKIITARTTREILFGSERKFAILNIFGTF